MTKIFIQKPKSTITKDGTQRISVHELENVWSEQLERMEAHNYCFFVKDEKICFSILIKE